MSTLRIESRRADLGHGLVVRRALPHAHVRSVGPFVFLDHAGPVVLPPDTGRSADVRPHPHIGLATVSYLLSGAVMHRDSLGVEIMIRPGDVNWMTAGRGIAHSERFEDESVFAAPGLELLQAWVALPEADEECEPAFAHTPLAELPVLEAPGLWLRVIAGTVAGLTSPVRTRSALFYAHARVAAGTALALPADYSERAAYVVAGRIESGTLAAEVGEMLVFEAGVPAALTATEDATVMLLGGEPLGPRFVWWNFVSSRRERIEQAKADWAAGRIALPPRDREEFIPLPSR